MSAYETHAEWIARISKDCPAMAYLRNVMRAIRKDAETQSELILADTEKFPMTEEGIKEAAKMVLEIDGPVTIRMHRCTLLAMYDGPYDRHNREEIIMDHNERAGVIIASLDNDGRMTKDVAVIAAATLSKSALLEAAQNAIELGDDA